MRRAPWLALALLAASPSAQGDLRLREVARVEASGAAVVQCVFDRSGTHMLTGGSAGDLVWWDMAELRPLRRIAALGRHITALAVHPRRPLAVVGVTPDNYAHASVHLVDLANGTTRRLWSRHAEALCFDGDGSRLAVAFPGVGVQRVQVFAVEGDAPATDAQPDFAAEVVAIHRPHLVFAPEAGVLVCSSWPEYTTMAQQHVRIDLAGGGQVRGAGAVAAFDPQGAPILATAGAGAFAVACDGSAVAQSSPAMLPNTVDRLRPQATTWPCRDLLDSWLERVFVAPGGTVVASDAEGQLHVFGPLADQHRFVAAHGGPATGLCWSPDSRFLAVHGPGALRIVDAKGRVVHDRAGSQCVAAGGDGPEFVIADRERMQTWNAAAGSAVGDATTWRDGRPRLLTSNPLYGVAASGAQTLHHAAVVLASSNGALFGRGFIVGRSQGPVSVGTDGRVRATEAIEAGPISHLSPGRGVFDAARGRALLSRFTQSGMCGMGTMGATVFGTVEALTADGQRTALQGFATGVLWLTLTADGDSLLVGLTDGTVHDLDPVSLASRRAWHLDPVLQWLLPLDARRAVAGAGDAPLLVELGPDLRVLGPAPAPAGLDHVHLAALAPNRRSLALAVDQDVHIVVVE